jgi:hypothetical protein
MVEKEEEIGQRLSTYVGDVTCMNVYVEIHVARLQTRLCRSGPHDMKG